MSHRFTGNAATQAIARATARLPQKRISPRPASIAPGIASITALSTISITVMETVSAASASDIAARNAIPAPSSGRSVSA
jgi:hypothetical protein